MYNISLIFTLSLFMHFTHMLVAISSPFHCISVIAYYFQIILQRFVRIFCNFFAKFLISKLLFYVSVEHQHIDLDNVRGNNPYIKYRTYRQYTIINIRDLGTNNKQILKRDYNHLWQYSSIYQCDYWKTLLTFWKILILIPYHNFHLSKHLMYLQVALPFQMTNWKPV